MPRAPPDTRPCLPGCHRQPSFRPTVTGQRSRSLRSSHPKTKAVDLAPGGDPVSVGGAEVRWRVAIAPTPDHPPAAITRRRRRSICRRPLLAGVPTILSPIPHVAVDIVDAVCVGTEVAHRSSKSVPVVAIGRPLLHTRDGPICGLIQNIAVPAKGLFVVAKDIARRCPGPRHVLAFGLRAADNSCPSCWRATR
jgi:hypothetical protein